jgi:hypothetical protein
MKKRYSYHLSHPRDLTMIHLACGRPTTGLPQRALGGTFTVQPSSMRGAQLTWQVTRAECAPTSYAEASGSAHSSYSFEKRRRSKLSVERTDPFSCILVPVVTTRVSDPASVYPVYLFASQKTTKGGIYPLRRSRRGGTAKVEEYLPGVSEMSEGPRLLSDTMGRYFSSTSAIVPPRRLRCRENRLVISQVRRMAKRG